MISLSSYPSRVSSNEPNKDCFGLYRKKFQNDEEDKRTTR